MIINFLGVLLCYNNNEYGSQIVIDGSQAKESSTGDCQCSITNDNATQLNISSYNNIQPEVGCGSTVRFQVGGQQSLRTALWKIVRFLTPLPPQLRWRMYYQRIWIIVSWLNQVNQLFSAKFLLLHSISKFT